MGTMSSAILTQQHTISSNFELESGPTINREDVLAQRAHGRSADWRLVEGTSNLNYRVVAPNSGIQLPKANSQTLGRQQINNGSGNVQIQGEGNIVSSQVYTGNSTTTTQGNGNANIQGYGNTLGAGSFPGNAERFRSWDLSIKYSNSHLIVSYHNNLVVYPGNYIPGAVTINDKRIEFEVVPAPARSGYYR